MENIILEIVSLLFIVVIIIFTIINIKISKNIKNNFKNVPNTLMEKSITFEKLAKYYFEKNKCNAKIKITKYQTDYSRIRNFLNISNKDNCNITKLNYSYMLFLIYSAIIYNQINTGFEVLITFYAILKTILYFVVFVFAILLFGGLSLVINPLYLGIFVLYIALILILRLFVYNKGKNIYDKIVICCENEIKSNNQFTKEDQEVIHLALINAKKPSLLKIFFDYSLINPLNYYGF